MLYTWGYQTLDFTFNWEDQQQDGAPKIAKLVYKWFNYGLW